MSRVTAWIQLQVAASTQPPLLRTSAIRPSTVAPTAWAVAGRSGRKPRVMPMKHPCPAASAKLQPFAPPPVFTDVPEYVMYSPSITIIPPLVASNAFRLVTIALVSAAFIAFSSVGGVEGPIPIQVVLLIVPFTFTSDADGHT